MLILSFGIRQFRNRSLHILEKILIPTFLLPSLWLPEERGESTVVPRYQKTTDPQKPAAPPRRVSPSLFLCLLPPLGPRYYGTICPAASNAFCLVPSAPLSPRFATLRGLPLPLPFFPRPAQASLLLFCPAFYNVEGKGERTTYNFGQLAKRLILNLVKSFLRLGVFDIKMKFIMDIERGDKV